MKTYLKSFLAILILLAMITPLFVQVPKTYATEATNQDKALTFLRDVVKLDMSLYTIKLGSQFIGFPPHLNGKTEEVIQYDLDYKNESTLYVTVRFRDNNLCGCSIIATRGTPIYVEAQTANTIDTVKAILDRYMTYSQSAYLKDMQSALNMIDSTNTVTTIGNVKLVTSSTTDLESKSVIDKFEWIYIVNDVDAPQNTVSIFLENGEFSSLGDSWDLYKIGSSSVNISQEEAIAIAKKTANDYTLMIMLDDWVEVPFNIKEEPVTTELFMYPRGDLTVFPFWRIELYFDKQYYSAYGIQVGVWADTGEIAYCYDLSTGGGPINDASSSPQTNNSNARVLAVIAIITVTAVATSGILITKRKQK